MLPDIQANPDYKDHPVFLWTASGGAIVSPLEADFCAQTGLTLEEAYGATPQQPSRPITSSTLPPATMQATSPDNAGEDMVVYEPLGQDDESLEDEDTINFLAQPCQPSHID